MNKHPLEQLSEIRETSQHPSNQERFHASTNSYNIICPQNNRENYNCPICTRLRKVCPYSKSTQPSRDGKYVYKSQYLQKSGLSTLPGERHRTLSNFDAVQSQSRRQSLTKVNEHNQYNQANPHIKLTQSEQVIYYPVIHNRFIISPAVQKNSSHAGTPARQKRGRKIEHDQDKILTPTQIKELLFTNRQ